MTQATPGSTPHATPGARPRSTPRADGFTPPRALRRRTSARCSRGRAARTSSARSWTTRARSGPRWRAASPGSSRSPWSSTRRRRTRRARCSAGAAARRRRRGAGLPHRPPPHPARRLVDPRQRPHLRARRRGPGGGGPVRVRRLGRALHALRHGRRGAGAPSPRPGACAATRRRSCSRAAPSTPTARARCSPPSSACCTTATSGSAARDNEELLKEWLGVEKVIWLPYGLVEDSGPLSTSGHVDDVAQFVAPGVVLAQTCEPDNVNYSRLQENLEVLEAATDAAGRRLEVVESPLLPYVSGVGAGLDGVQRARRRHPHAGALRQHGLRGGRRPAAAHRRRGRGRDARRDRRAGRAASRSACRRSSRRSAAAGWAASRSRCPPARSRRR